MPSPPLVVETEQLLVPVDGVHYNINLRIFEPATAIGTVFCLHGYVGNGRDFAALGEFLALNGYRVICPDMFGRGDSAYFEQPGRYSIGNTTRAAAAVFDRYRSAARAVIGIGWGAVVALLALRASRVPISHFVSAELPLDFSVDTDPVIASSLAAPGSTFASAEAALAFLLATPEFAGANGVASPTLTHRIRHSATGWRLNHDDGIVQRTQDFAGRHFDLAALFPGPPVDLMLMYGRRPEATEAAALARFRSAAPSRTIVSGLGAGHRLLLREPGELLTILGFLRSAPGTISSFA